MRQVLRLLDRLPLKQRSDNPDAGSDHPLPLLVRTLSKPYCVRVDRVSESLPDRAQTRCKLIVSKIAVGNPCRDHQNVIRVRNILMVFTTSVDEFRVFVNSIDFAKKYGRISLILQKSPDRYATHGESTVVAT